MVINQTYDQIADIEWEIFYIMIAFSMTEVGNKIANILSFFSPRVPRILHLMGGRGGEGVEGLKKKKIHSVLQQFVLYEKKY